MDPSTPTRLRNRAGARQPGWLVRWWNRAGSRGPAGGSRLITVVRRLRQRLAEVLTAQTRRAVDQNYPGTSVRGAAAAAAMPAGPAPTTTTSGIMRGSHSSPTACCAPLHRAGSDNVLAGSPANAAMPTEAEL